MGTGLGYQAAVLAELAGEIYTVEILEELGRDGEGRLRAAGYAHIRTRIGNGSYGWPEHAPFDKIMVTAAPELIPPMLIEQLKPGGRMLIPIGEGYFGQNLILVEKDPEGRVSQREVLSVAFVALRHGEAEVRPAD